MEIERIVSGDLTKNIEQCVSILMDVERRVSTLKNELLQAAGTLPVPRQALGVNGFAGITPVAAATFGQAPLVGAHLGITPGIASLVPGVSPLVQGVGIHPTLQGSVASLPSLPLLREQLLALALGQPLALGQVQSLLLSLGVPVQSLPIAVAQLQALGLNIAVPLPSLPLQGLPAFAPLVHQGIAPVAPVQGAYIW